MSNSYGMKMGHNIMDTKWYVWFKDFIISENLKSTSKLMAGNLYWMVFTFSNELSFACVYILKSTVTL